MRGKTLTRADIVATLMREHRLTESESRKIIEDILRAITDALVAGECSKLDNFGAFICREKAAREGRNPRTGERVLISARRAVTFRASKALKEKVRKGCGRSNQI